eukprot:3809827-Amphidinium_carterae.1
MVYSMAQKLHCAPAGAALVHVRLLGEHATLVNLSVRMVQCHAVVNVATEIIGELMLTGPVAHSAGAAADIIPRETRGAHGDHVLNVDERILTTMSFKELKCLLNQVAQ